jgi:hypothetical protein
MRVVCPKCGADVGFSVSDADATGRIRRTCEGCRTSVLVKLNRRNLKLSPDIPLNESSGGMPAVVLPEDLDPSPEYDVNGPFALLVDSIEPRHVALLRRELLTFPRFRRNPNKLHDATATLPYLLAPLGWREATRLEEHLGELGAAFTMGPFGWLLDQEGGVVPADQRAPRPRIVGAAIAGQEQPSVSQSGAFEITFDLGGRESWMDESAEVESVQVEAGGDDEPVPESGELLMLPGDSEESDWVEPLSQPSVTRPMAVTDAEDADDPAGLDEGAPLFADEDDELVGLVDAPVGEDGGDLDDRVSAAMEALRDVDLDDDEEAAAAVDLDDAAGPAPVPAVSPPPPPPPVPPPPPSPLPPLPSVPLPPPSPLLPQPPVPVPPPPVPPPAGAVPPLPIPQKPVASPPPVAAPAPAPRPAPTPPAPAVTPAARTVGGTPLLVTLPWLDGYPVLCGHVMGFASARLDLLDADRHIALLLDEARQSLVSRAAAAGADAVVGCHAAHSVAPEGPTWRWIVTIEGTAVAKVER